MSENHVRKMKVRMRLDLTEAMKARRTEETAVLRSLLAAIDNAEAPQLTGLQPVAGGSSEVDRLVLTAAETQAVLLREIRSHEQAAAELAGLGHGERADGLLRQAAIARQYVEQIASD